MAVSLPKPVSPWKKALAARTERATWHRLNNARRSVTSRLNSLGSDAPTKATAAAARWLVEERHDHQKRKADTDCQPPPGWNWE